MGLIPAQDKTNEFTVTTAKEALVARETVEAALRLRLEGANGRAVALAAEAGDASAAVYISEAAQASAEVLEQLRATAAAKIAELDKTKAECAALSHAVNVAAGQSADARMALVRVQHRNHINRVARTLERLLSETVRLENSIETSNGHYRTILKHLETLKASWPGELPMLEILSMGGLSSAIEMQTYKVSAVIDDYLGIPSSRYPGSRCPDPTLISKPDAIPSLSDQIDQARKHCLDILEGRKNHSGQPTGPSEPVIQTGAELVNGKLKSAAATPAA